MTGVRRVRLDAGGYTSRGEYFGRGGRVYVDDETGRHYRGDYPGACAAARRDRAEYAAQEALRAELLRETGYNCRDCGAFVAPGHTCGRCA